MDADNENIGILQGILLYIGGSIVFSIDNGVPKEECSDGSLSSDWRIDLLKVNYL